MFFSKRVCVLWPVMFSLDYNPLLSANIWQRGKLWVARGTLIALPPSVPSSRIFSRNWLSPGARVSSMFYQSLVLWSLTHIHATYSECSNTHCSCALSKIVPRIYGVRGMAAATKLIPKFIGFMSPMHRRKPRQFRGVLSFVFVPSLLNWVYWYETTE